MSRQLHEATRIMNTTGTLLNDKTEYSRCIIPSLQTDVTPWDKKTRQNPRPETDAQGDRRRSNKSKRRYEEVHHEIPDAKRRRPAGDQADDTSPAEAGRDIQHQVTGESDVGNQHPHND